MCVGGLVVSLSSLVCWGVEVSIWGSRSDAGAAHLWESMEVREDSGKGAGAVHRDCEDVVVVAGFRSGGFCRAAAVATCPEIFTIVNKNFVACSR